MKRQSLYGRDAVVSDTEAKKLKATNKPDCVKYADQRHNFSQHQADLPFAEYLTLFPPNPLPRHFFTNPDVVEVAKQLVGKLIWTSTADPVNPQQNAVACGRIIETEAYRAPEDRASHAYNYRKTKRNSVMYGPGGAAYVYLCYGIHSMMNVVTNEENIPHAVLLRSIEPMLGVGTMLIRRKRQHTILKDATAVLKQGKKILFEESAAQCKRIKMDPLSSYLPVQLSSLQTSYRMGKRHYTQIKDKNILHMPSHEFLHPSLFKYVSSLGQGPGCLTQALGIDVNFNGVDILEGQSIWITPCPSIEEWLSVLPFQEKHVRSSKGASSKLPSNEIIAANHLTFADTILASFLQKMKWFEGKLPIIATPRIGVDYSGEDAKLPWRFYVDGHPCVTRSRK